MSKQTIAPGITVEMKDNKAIIEVDTTQDLGLSKSGKSTNVATTHGFVTLPNGQRLSLNQIKSA